MQTPTDQFRSIVIILHLFFVTGSVVNGQDAPKSSTPSFVNGSFRGKPCNADNLESCWGKLPTLKDPHIPNSVEEVQIVCRGFKIGMECVDEYSNQCLTPKQRSQLYMSVEGAHEAFRFLCKDAKFQSDFLRHNLCYRRIGRKWDDCAALFIAALKKTDQKKSLAVCCIRLRFLQCINGLLSMYCDSEATLFLRQMAETLVSNKVKTSNSTCTVSNDDCAESSGACSRLKSSKPSFAFFSSILNLFPIFSHVSSICSNMFASLLF